jgi:hypothetical protein
MAGIGVPDQTMATAKLPITLKGSINQLFEVVNRIEATVGINEKAEEPHPEPSNKILAAANAIDEIRTRLNRVCNELETLG